MTSLGLESCHKLEDVAESQVPYIEEDTEALLFCIFGENSIYTQASLTLPGTGTWPADYPPDTWVQDKLESSIVCEQCVEL